MNSGIAPSGYYEKHYSGRDWRWYKSILALAIQYSEPGPILDVGAGAGFLLEAALRWNQDCLGLEGSAEAIEIARQRCESLRYVHHLLSEPFPIDDREFQTVIVHQVIEHLEPAVAANCLAECFRVLRPGGMICVLSPSKYNRRESKADPTHMHMYSPKSLKRLLRSTGFVEVKAFDAPLNLLGQSQTAKYAMIAIFKLTRCEWISATANCIAWKPTTDA